MKKLAIILFAAGLVLALTLPAAALESTFGGMWRIRAFTQQSFTGEDQTGTKDLTQTDTRWRWYYFGKVSDNLRFVARFEVDYVYGAPDKLGDIGADGGSQNNATGMEIKHIYTEFKTGPVQWTLGTQGYSIARGFLFNDDFSGAVINYKVENFEIPFIWVKATEGGMGRDTNNQDLDYYMLNPSMKFGNWKFNPYFAYVYSDVGANSAVSEPATVVRTPVGTMDDVGLFYLGADADLKWDKWNFWATAIWSGGEVKKASNGVNYDANGYLFGVGADGALGPFGVRGQFVYSSGDDDDTDTNIDAFIPMNSQSYYWAEIMGYGLFDNQVSANSPDDSIYNIWFVSGGLNYKLIEKLKVGADLWYAKLTKTAGDQGDTLGTEIDVWAQYEIMPRLTLDAIFAYLFSDDGTYQGANEADPWETGVRVQLTW